jgi:hypothetical protein
MPPRTPTQLITVDPSKPAWEQEKPLHNRWHPDIPPVSLLASKQAIAELSVRLPYKVKIWHQTRNCIYPALCKPRATMCKQHIVTACGRVAYQVAEVTEGQLFRVESLDWTGGQIKDDDNADDIKKVRMGG